MFKRTSQLRSLVFVSTACFAIFSTSASAGLFDLSGSGATSSFPNSVKLGGTLTCEIPNLAIYLDTEAPYLVLTDKDAVADYDPSSTGPIPATPVYCTETVNGTSVYGTGMLQQLSKSGTISAGGGNGPAAVPSGLVVTSDVDTTANSTKYTFRFYADDRQTAEKLRYVISFDTPATNPLCVNPEDSNNSFIPCEHHMGLPDPNLGEDEVTKGSEVFCAYDATDCPEADADGNPSTPPLSKYVVEELSVTVSNADQSLLAFSQFQARWLHNGSENGNDPIIIDYKDDSAQGKPIVYKLRTKAETDLDIPVEVDVNPKVNVTDNPSGSSPVYFIGSTLFDATKVSANSITVDDTTVTCNNTSAVYFDNDSVLDWKCGVDTLEFINATGLDNCQATDVEWTSEFKVPVLVDGETRTAVGEDTYPINCNIK